MLRAFLWKIVLVVVVLLATHVHQHTTAQDGLALKADCHFCHVFGQPMVAPPLGYALALALVWLVWTFSHPHRVAVARQWRCCSRGPPGACV